jgi:hypothetical protein
LRQNGLWLDLILPSAFLTLCFVHLQALFPAVLVGTGYLAPVLATAGNALAAALPKAPDEPASVADKAARGVSEGKPK